MVAYLVGQPSHLGLDSQQMRAPDPESCLGLEDGMRGCNNDGGAVPCDANRVAPPSLFVPPWVERGNAVFGTGATGRKVRYRPVETPWSEAVAPLRVKADESLGSQLPEGVMDFRSSATEFSS
jgi:hypothetical protein